MKRILTIVLLVLLTSATAFAVSPDISGDALEEVELEWGFAEDPWGVEITAGGPDEFDSDEDITVDYGEEWVWGYINASGPDIRFFYSSDDPSELFFWFESSDGSDTFLVINDPDNEWWVVDDYEESLDPGFGIEGAPGGTYDIWIGTWGEDLVDGAFYISEMDVMLD